MLRPANILGKPPAIGIRRGTACRARRRCLPPRRPSASGFAGAQILASAFAIPGRFYVRNQCPSVFICGSIAFRPTATMI